ncbi:DUF5683 domain-containing protein [Wenyingzhuangia sp. 2_MG-2023]|uniref:DUF5683 domain-containing protein n=1 Tax=Wenyingzhuangia sp. 2_MG-2023 TaxID=3062639 RepID=UPI0026E4196B|nr:DUF5683 domain-containing protein [Wenyingzhuangia sp. 2_MG-2023]MDO6737852.1 DUF5683 domain-containing protein [Wenyingzhuangia sp. 2_MG-2023]
MSIFSVFSQETESQLSASALDSKNFLEDTDSFNPLSPAKAAFYSAIIPGLGQAYNRRYWKIPIVYGALASSLYYYSTNNTSYKRYRKAFKQRQAGEIDEFYDILSIESLENAQQVLRSNRDTSLLTFVGLYALQILEASIDAHLLQFNVSDKITFDPLLINDQLNNQNYIGLSLNLNF